MKTLTRNTFKLAVALMMVVGLLGVSNVFAASLPTSSCTSSGGVATCDLYATTGTAALGPTSVNIWGFSASNTANSATLPGPILIVNQGDTVTVTLHNIDIPEGVSLNFPGQSLAPDLSAGASADGITSYTFTANKPGTFLYEAGLAPGKQHQTAMGMYGALIVKPADGTAYGTSGSAYDEETILVLSEIDTALNGSATPATFEMRNFAPKYFLINGKAYASPFTGDIGVNAGHKVLLRYVNAGMQAHAMSTLGISQKVIANDGHALNHPHSMVAETIATGQTLDVLVSIPAAAANGTKFPVYDANLMLRNATASGLGGMMTFLTVGTLGTPADTGPFVTALSLTPAKVGGTSPSDVIVNATISDANTTTVNNILAAEYYIDSTAGAPTALTGTFGSATANVTGTISTSGLTSGSHTVYVRGQDSASNWSAFLSTTLIVDKTGPTTSGLTLSPNPSSGVVSVALSGTANDTTSGNSNVTAAEYWVDAGAHTAITIATPSPSVSLNATIPSGLSMGSHIVSVRSQDSYGNWGAVATITLQVADTQAPTTSGVIASPNPNNGSMPFNTSVQAVRVAASFSDVATGNSNIAAAEGFIDTVAANGTGFVFIANDGTFNSPAEPGYSDIPLAVIGTLASGNHTIYVHAKDAAGNWGAMATTVLVIDKTPPTVVSINRVGNQFTNASSVQWLVTFSEPVTGVTASNFGLVESLSGSTTIQPVIGSGTTWTVTSTTGSGSGTIGLNLTLPTGIKDLVGNAMTSAGLPFTGQVYSIDRTVPTFTGVTLTPNSISVGTASVTLAITGTSDPTNNGVSSGVNGGEYWICPSTCTNPAAGSGTAFSGTSVSVPTAALLGGHQYTIRARVRDAAGNWSTTVNGAVLTVTPSNNIFTNGFESGNTTGWSSTSGTVTVNTASALFGINGMQVAGNSINYLQYNLASSATTYDARFYFQPNGNSSSGKDIFAAATNSAFGTQLFHVRYRLNGTQRQVQIQIGSTANTSWVNINNSAHYFEVVWQSGGNLVLYVDGVSSQTLTGASGAIGAVRLGSVTSTGNNTAIYFDAFSSKSTASPLLGQ